MAERYLLYIDILGFSDLVQEDESKISDLYEVFAALNVHNHLSFKAIIFSDTILVYNVADPDDQSDRSYLVMYLCEFAQELQHDLTKKDIFFRAVLVRGDFQHYELNGIPCFFGKSLIYAYESEKQIPAIGLFMHNSLTFESDIFPTRKFNEQFSFVFITQALTRLETDFGGEFPQEGWIFDETDETFLATPEVLYLERLAYFAANHPVLKVREKHETTLKLFKEHYPKTFYFLEHHNFDVHTLSPTAGWDKALAQWPQSFSWAIKKRNDF
jgi:hypothetical protein